MKAARQRWFVPEVVQTSAMDCGPAALVCLLAGFGISVSYGRLREACQTDVDGTSIDTLHDIAVTLGLEAEQLMVPLDHLLLPDVLPAIVVVRSPGGATHFLVAWRRHGPWVQLMDPATGRRWTTHQSFLADVYVHQQPVERKAWRYWAASKGFAAALEHRLGAVGVSTFDVRLLLEQARSNTGWRALAALDAAARAVVSLVHAGGLRRGAQAARTLVHLAEAAANDPTTLPECFWSVQPQIPSSTTTGEPDLLFSGAVLVRIRPRTYPTSRPTEALPRELAAVLQDPASQPGRQLLHLLGTAGWWTPLALVAALTVAAAGLVLEALVLRALVELGSELGLFSQRLGAAVLVLLLAVLLLALDLPIATLVRRLGRQLEVRLRTAFLTKIPRLDDRYFRSRLISDMAERGHAIEHVRLLPELGSEILRLAFALVLTTAGIIWLDPPSAPWALLALAGSVLVPLLAQPLLAERDMRLRSHAAALGRFMLDGLLGLVAVRAHGAEPAVRRQHEGLLVDWLRAGTSRQRVVVVVEGLQLGFGFGLAALLLQAHLERSGSTSSLLLLVYWALSLPSLAEQLAELAWSYPAHRNLTLRLLEPLGAVEPGATAAGPATAAPPQATPEPAGGVAISFAGVSVQAGGHTVLDQIDLDIAAGAHIAIVGPSGAGKSSLVGLLLGWHQPSAGTMLVDGQPLNGDVLERLRRETAWVDPGVQLWNRSLLENLLFGNGANARAAVGTVIEAADLWRLLEQLPAGLQTSLGEGGALVSGGEGQRVRLARALLRTNSRLVILDEPFRGLDRDRRRQLLGRCRNTWPTTTLLCISHDIADTASFDRVLVIEGGRLIEDGRPAVLAATPSSRYAALLAAEAAVRQSTWTSTAWRQLHLRDGLLAEHRSQAGP